jgi:hypothetical protein
VISLYIFLFGQIQICYYYRDITNQPLTQELIDNAAFDIVYEKSFPGHKMLHPRIYCTLLAPDPRYVFTMTNIKIIFNKISHIAYINYKQKSQCKKRNVKVPDTCCPQQNSSSQNNCSETDDSKSICILPFTKQYPCPEIVANNSKYFQNTFNTNSPTKSKMNKPRNSNDSEYIQSNEYHLPYDHTFASSKSENKSLKCEEKPNIAKCELNISSKKQPNNSYCCSSQNQTNSKQLCYSNNNNSKSRAQISQTSNVCNSSLDDSSNYNWTMSSVESLSNENAVPGCNRTPINSNRIHVERRCNQLPYVESTNRNHQIQEHVEPPLHCNYMNRSHLAQSQNADNFNHNISNETPKRYNRRTCSSNSERRNTSIPCNLNQTSQCFRSDKKRQCQVNQNNSCPTCSEHQQNNYLNTPVINNNRQTLPAMDINCSNRNEIMMKPRYDDNFDPNISSYSRFSNRNNHFDGRNDEMRFRSSSCHDLPSYTNNNNQDIHSDKSSDFSDWSDEIDFQHSTNSNNSYSLTSLTSYSSSSLGNIDVDNNRIIGSVNPIHLRNNNPEIYEYQRDNIQINDSDTRNIENYTMMEINNDWEHSSNNFSQQNIEDISMPHMDFEESDLISLPRDNFQDLENMTMPNNSYRTNDLNNISIDDYSAIQNSPMPNNSLEGLSSNNNRNNC